MAGSDCWATFKRLASQLQRVDVGSLSDQEKKAFFVNVYNVLVIHGTVAKGIPTSQYQRYK